MKIYVSVPIRDRKGSSDMEKKIAAKRQVDVIKEKLLKEGHEVITPFDINPIDSDIPYEEAMGEDIKVLLKCDGIYKASGWGHSRGCQFESMNSVRFKNIQKDRKSVV